MGDKENPNTIDIPTDLLIEILLRLALKSLVKLKTVSKEWRSILDSKSFGDMYLSFQKSGKNCRKILAACHCDCGGPPSLLPGSGFKGNEEIVSLHCDVTRPSMSCDGLVCLPEPGWVNVVNPATGQLRRFASGPDPVSSLLIPPHKDIFLTGHWSTYFPGYWAMGFGRDKVRGSYKVVRMFFDPSHSEILDVNIGEWRKLSPPPYPVHVGRKSVCVNGSIYWFEIGSRCKILALDLHTQEFHNVAMPAPFRYKMDTQIVNLEDSLALVTSGVNKNLEWQLEILSMDAQKESWSLMYLISLADLHIRLLEARWFTPVTVSKQGNLLIYDNKRRLYKYYPRTNIVRRISPHTCIVLSPYLETLFQLQTDQLDLRTGRTICISKVWIASAQVISSLRSRVDKFLCRGKAYSQDYTLQICDFDVIIAPDCWSFNTRGRGDGSLQSSPTPYGVNRPLQDLTVNAFLFFYPT
ncbi:unnamed protein product [Microthlaspi erraticum]|uniref:F-box domain-containing protein n=1 Tax=Microthlaspi erraticum TaxID=1685480 RepID=A0A6D2KF58_9BRAS|nr:unnamed protein product [Microthlaspi erraticum]